jgi:hypothetical protein
MPLFVDAALYGLAFVLEAVVAAAETVCGWALRACGKAVRAAEDAWVRWHAPARGGCCTAARDWDVTKVLLLEDDDKVGLGRSLGRIDDISDDDADDSAEPAEPVQCADVTLAFDPDAWAGGAWEALARAAAPPDFGANARVEVRYAAAGKKFRLVLRPGDAFQWPPYDAPRPACRMPRGVLSAELKGHDRADSVDVTSRVKKYAGPHADFYAGKGLRVRLRDMFPSDAAMRARFRCLRVVYANLRVREFGFQLDPIIE